MKLPAPPTSDLTAQLHEFDVWITPTFGEIKDTVRFQQEMENIISVFEAIGAASKKFATAKDCSATAIAETFTKLVEGKTKEDAEDKLQALAAVLFLVTGKSDNNSKCQFPLYLRDVARSNGLPRLKRTGKEIQVVFEEIPRVLTAESYMKRVASLSAYKEYQQRLLQEFIDFVLGDESCISQLWSIGRAYFMLKRFKKERDLLTPLVVFQVRGSVSASGGHKPEELLRARLAEWGLQKEVDYNIKDVTLKREDKTEVKPEQVEEETGSETKATRKKTRAYDFVIPFNTPGWKPIIFIQSQFYAGDSGSVSHKNVDRTDTSRNYILSLVPDARFVEYVDGAGYFSSLNGDLKTLLDKPTTASFFQVRSAAIRLRRELQQIGFLVPLELYHAILRSNGIKTDVYRLLIEEDYTEQEIERCLSDCIQRHLVTEEDDDRLSLTAERRTVARRYFLLDIVARSGEALPKSRLSGSLMVPGYGPFYGMKLPNMVSEALRLAPNLRQDWSDPQVITGDISWLCDEGLAMSS